MRKPSRRSWRNLLLDTEYQLVFTLALVFSAALFMAGLGYVVMREADTATRTAIQEVQGETLLDGGLAETTIAKLQQRRVLLDQLLVAFGVALSAGLFAYGIKMTHHIAGPIYKVSRYCDALAAGRFQVLSSLRRGDQLNEFYTHFRSGYEVVRARELRELSCLRAVVAAAEAGDVAARSPDLSRRLDDLRALLAEKEVALG